MLTLSAKQLLILVLVGSCLSATMVAQRIQFRLTAKNITPISTNTFNFTVAADPDGTDSLDTALGEIEIPDIPLPGNIFYVWTIAPIETTIWLSPLDIRYYDVGLPSTANHDLRINWNGGKLEIGWSGPLPSQIDSMYITDGFSEFPDNVIKVKVAPGAKFETDNPAFDRFRVLVWYNGSTTSVAEEVTPTPSVHFSPHPVGEVLHLAELEGVTDIQIRDLNGRLVRQWSNVASSVTLQVNDLVTGMYIIGLVGFDGAVRTSPLVHY